MSLCELSVLAMIWFMNRQRKLLTCLMQVCVAVYVFECICV